MSDKLSPNFTVTELTRSATAIRQGIPNVAPPEAVENLRRVCVECLEPIRALLGVPLHVTSGYRSPALNIVVGSTAKRSAHLDGRAADVEPVGMDVVTAFEMIRASHIPYDQLIEEMGPDGWIHVGIAPTGQPPRRQALRARGGPGAWTYEAV